MLPRCPLDASLKMLFQFNFNALWILINALPMLLQCSSSAPPMLPQCYINAQLKLLQCPSIYIYYDITSIYIYYDITKISMEQACPSGRVYICPFSPPPPPPPPGIFMNAHIMLFRCSFDAHTMLFNNTTM